MKMDITAFILIALISLSGCRKVDEHEFKLLREKDIPDWKAETHGLVKSPDYNSVFPQNEVIRIDIKIENDDWATMQADLASNIGSSSGGPGGGPGGGPMGGGVNSADYEPVWVPSSVFYHGIEWYKVGVRFKGNSSLFSAYQSGVNKLSFKLDFDEYEDEFPILADQRFYGFKQLNLKNNYDDKSFVREKVSSDLFLKFGVASPQTTFCELYVDYGDGPQYFGLYTLVEEVDDKVIDNQFSQNTGNLYKPDGDAASFASGTYNESEMEKKSNEDLADYSDVLSLYNTINSSTRNTNIDSWKTELEKILDVEIFLKWLAANTVMQNWDTYGKMTHNYYLYNNPGNGLLTWIPWDNNEALQEGKQGGAVSLSLDEVGNNWPLIRYIIDVPEYEGIYKQYVSDFTNNVFTVNELNSLYDTYYALLKDYAYAEVSGYTFLQSNSDFDRAINELKTHVQERNSDVINYLN